MLRVKSPGIPLEPDLEAYVTPMGAPVILTSTISLLALEFLVGHNRSRALS